MPRIFNAIRASIFSEHIPRFFSVIVHQQVYLTDRCTLCCPTAAVLVFAIIVLSVAAYLSSILVPSNLSTSPLSNFTVVQPQSNSIHCHPARFVDIALFVSIFTILCTATMCVTCSPSLLLPSYSFIYFHPRRRLN